MPREVETRWGLVGIWTRFRSRVDGSTWVTLPTYPARPVRVRSLATGAVALIDPRPDERVTVLMPTEDEALALLGRHLGASLIASWWEVPAAAIADASGLMRHLARAHATPTGFPTHAYGRSLDSLAAYHWRFHASALGSPGPTMTVAHTHTA